MNFKLRRTLNDLVRLFGGIAFQHRNWLFPLIMLALIGLFPPRFSRGEYLIDALGWGIAILGELFRTATVGWAYIRRGGRDGEVYAESLRSEGMFALCRNPLYFGNLVILMGLLVMYGNFWLLGIGLPIAFGTYSSIVATEEQHLHEKFGEEYQRYCDRVHRWIPDFRKFLSSIRELHFSWSRVVIREYSSFCMWTGVGLTLMLYESWVMSVGTMEAWGVLMVLDAIVLFTARYLKKQNILTVSSPIIHQSNSDA